MTVLLRLRYGSESRLVYCFGGAMGPEQQGLLLNLGQLADCLAFSQALKCFKRSLSCDTMINNRRRVILAQTNAGV